MANYVYIIKFNFNFAIKMPILFNFVSVIKANGIKDNFDQVIANVVSIAILTTTIAMRPSSLCTASSCSSTHDDDTTTTDSTIDHTTYNTATNHITTTYDRPTTHYYSTTDYYSTID